MIQSLKLKIGRHATFKITETQPNQKPNTSQTWAKYKKKTFKIKENILSKNVLLVFFLDEKIKIGKTKAVYPRW